MVMVHSHARIMQTNRLSGWLENKSVYKINIHSKEIRQKEDALHALHALAFYNF